MSEQIFTPRETGDERTVEQKIRRLLEELAGEVKWTMQSNTPFRLFPEEMVRS